MPQLDTGHYLIQAWLQAAESVSRRDTAPIWVAFFSRRRHSFGTGDGTGGGDGAVGAAALGGGGRQDALRTRGKGAHQPCPLWMCFCVPCQVFALAVPTVTRVITSRILPVVADCSGALQAADIAARHESALEAVADSAAAVEEGEGDRALKYALAAVRALVGDDGAPVRDKPGLDDDLLSS